MGESSTGWEQVRRAGSLVSRSDLDELAADLVRTEESLERKVAETDEWVGGLADLCAEMARLSVRRARILEGRLDSLDHRLRVHTHDGPTARDVERDTEDRLAELPATEETADRFHGKTRLLEEALVRLRYISDNDEFGEDLHIQLTATQARVILEHVSMLEAQNAGR